MIKKKVNKNFFLKNFKNTIYELTNLREILIYSEMYYKIKKKNFILLNKRRLRIYKRYRIFKQQILNSEKRRVNKSKKLHIKRK
jgi:hypothetical protein